MVDWLAKDPGLVWSAFGVIWLGATWALKKWADALYEPKRPIRTPEEQQHRNDSLARSILSGEVIKEFAENTKNSAYGSTGFRESVENIARTSVPFRDAVDERVKHGFNNFDSTLALALTTLGDRLQEGFRKQAADSQIIYMDAIGDLKEAVQDIAKTLGEHMAEDRARREK